ncbi:translation elongation factor Ts [Rubripirellula amarantea]|uniref:Elongation factor Ts n=1 Tax=Rubripirellula amarantea TaxID=2527999 RepID=A0A5C5WUI4_9BACT|nr:translation elongation factor Ts [Rubripirellula amarantea]MDA8744257.1 translation elongation factor Ts [Rubripirellula amarantea]TWT54220.1 Elongation factor Ts [Rubripirellula amarantea]
MAISAKDVSDLRKSTGAGMMDCKKALEESGGDIDGALDYLRKKGKKVAEKRGDREASEGVVVAKTDGNRSILVALCCETDFVAKNEGFIELADQIATLAMENKVDTIEALNELKIGNSTVSERLIDETGKIGEKIQISDLQVVEGDNIASYIHAGSKIGVLVSFKDGGKDGADQFFRGVAMHIAAMKPSILHPDEFDADFVQKETEALQAQINAENELNEKENLGKPVKTVPQFASRRQLTPEVMKAAEDAIKAELAAEGKPEKIWDKIVPGKLDRFVADNTLLDQERCLMSQFYALDDTKTVEAAVKEFSPEAEVVQFRRVSVG